MRPGLKRTQRIVTVLVEQVTVRRQADSRRMDLGPNPGRRAAGTRRRRRSRRRVRERTSRPPRTTSISLSETGTGMKSTVSLIAKSLLTGPSDAQPVNPRDALCSRNTSHFSVLAFVAPSFVEPFANEFVRFRGCD